MLETIYKLNPMITNVGIVALEKKIELECFSRILISRNFTYLFIMKIMVTQTPIWKIPLKQNWPFGSVILVF